MTTINLFCLPFSGGNKHSYRSFQSVAPDHIRLVPVEIPGRGSRYDEPLLLSLYTMADDIIGQLQHQVHTPYAIYGHSMGGLLACLVIRRIRQLEWRLPLHLFVTGCGGPSCRFGDLVDHRLPKEPFFNKIRELGGMPDELLSNEALMDFFEPILRADFEAVATYQHTVAAPFAVPVTAIIGTEERISREEAEAWQQETMLPVEVIEMKGDHFFIFNHEEEILKIISGKFDRVVSSL